MDRIFNWLDFILYHFYINRIIMSNNNQQPPQENPNNQFSNNEPMTFAQKVKYVKSTEMTNNKQQTAVEWFAKKVMHLDWKFSNQKEKEKIIQQAKEMHRQQAINLYYEYERYVMMNQSDEMITESVIMTFGQFYKKTYGGGEK